MKNLDPSMIALLSQPLDSFGVLAGWRPWGNASGRADAVYRECRFRGLQHAMNALDIVIGIILVFTLVRGIFRGLVEEISSIIGIFGGIYGAVFYYPAAGQFLRRWISDPAYVNIIGFLIIFGGIFILVGILGVLIKYLLNIASLGWFDRLGGAAFGGIKGVLIASVLLMVLTTFLPGGTPLLKTSRLAPHVAVITEGIVKIIPKDMKTRFSNKYQKVKDEWKAKQ